MSSTCVGAPRVDRQVGIVLATDVWSRDEEPSPVGSLLAVEVHIACRAFWVAHSAARMKFHLDIRIGSDTESETMKSLQRHRRRASWNQQQLFWAFDVDASCTETQCDYLYAIILLKITSTVAASFSISQWRGIIVHHTLWSHCAYYSFQLIFIAVQSYSRSLRMLCSHPFLGY